MIYILEDNRQSVSGNTSLFIASKYDSRLIDVIKEEPVYAFHKESQLWEVPITSLASLLDKFVYFDDVQLIVKDDVQETKDVELHANFRTTPRDYQLEGIKYGLTHDKFMLLDEPGLGKAVSLDTPVLTKQGFIPMRDIKVGDILYDEQGKECKVLNTYDHNDLNMYRITFNDETFVDCCEDHLWKFSYETCTHPTKNKTGVKRVDTIKDTKWIVSHNWKRHRLVFPRCQPIQFDKKDLPLHPYVLGCLLGDGGLSIGSIQLASADAELIDKVNNLLPLDYHCKYSRGYNYVIKKKDTLRCKENVVKDILRSLNLWGHKSNTKFIPEIYKYSCVEDRLELLRGLLDTDGYASREGNVLQFSSTSKQLCDDVAFLVESLGGLVNRKQKQGKYRKNCQLIKTQIVYTLTIRIDDPSQLVSLSRKKSRLSKRKFCPRRMIKSIEKIDTHKGKCITVDSPNSLYVIKDFIVTHNTLITMYIAEELKERECLEHCLVVCGLASLRTNWIKEINKHSKLSGMMLGARINKNDRLVWDGIPKRVEQLSKPIDEFFIVTNIETLRDERIIDIIKNGPNKIDMIVVDEGHCIKSWKSTQGKNLLELTAKHQIIATGTPLLNNPLDTYMLLAWIGKEKKRGITQFKNTYCILDKNILGGIAGFKNLDMLQGVIDSCSIRRTKDILNLPEKTIIDEELTMSDTQSNFYKTLDVFLGDEVTQVDNEVLQEKKKKERKELQDKAKEICDRIKLKPQFTRSMFTRLRQATSCPSVLTSQNIESIKIERAIELAKEIISNGEKVVIFSEFKEPVYRLQKALSEYNPLIGTGDIADSEFSSNIDKFQQDDKYKVFIGTCSKCGTGITLTAASYMIFIDQPWTYGEYQQCTDRIHRIGTTKPVFIYNLICKDTIDELVQYILQKKSTLATFVVDKEVDDKMRWILNRCVPDTLFY